MQFRASMAQYPVSSHSSLDQWRKYVETWFVQAQSAGSRMLVFPEYGSLELTSLLSPEDQVDIKKQNHQLSKFLEDFLDLYKFLSMKYKMYCLAPSIPQKMGASFVNRAYFFSPAGQIDFQDKIHMTRFEDEEWGISPGSGELKIFETDFGSISVQICFDIEFSAISSWLAQQGAEIILNPSCTEGLAGYHRVHVGARARALENQIFILVAQTVGEAPWSPAVDKNTGAAAAYSTCDSFFPEDGVLVKGLLNQPGLIHCDLNLENLKKVRQTGQVFNFKYTSQYEWNKILGTRCLIKKVLFKT